MCRRKHFVLGIDGLPYDFLLKLIKKGKMPNLDSILKTAKHKAISSVYPPVSSVAWTSYATGVNPGGHNIYGFVEKDWDQALYIPTSSDRTASPIWRELSEKNKRVVTINVPFTYPPEPVNGIQISCFLCPDINKGTYPTELSTRLKEMNYIIDVEAPRKNSDKNKFLQDLFHAMKKRVELSKEFMEYENWDYFHLHIMETDRMFHFFWNSIGNETADEFTPEIYKFFEVLDNYIHVLYEKLPKDTQFTILSDHGFCGIESEVQLNAWLAQEGYLEFTSFTDRGVSKISSSSSAYSLTPGRVYINKNLKMYERDSIFAQIQEKLLQLEDSKGNRVIQKIFKKEEIYSGKSTERAADMIVHPTNGFDLKSDFSCATIFTRSLLNGMHTYENAVLISTSLPVSQINNITEVAHYIKKELLVNDNT